MKKENAKRVDILGKEDSNCIVFLFNGWEISATTVN